MKEKLTKNLGYKLLSVPLATIVWLLIINMDNPVLTKDFANITVDILNESYIASSGQVYDIEANSVTVTIKARRKVRDKIKPNDIRVTADLANITLYNKVELVAECPKYQLDILEITTRPKMLTVSLEERETESKSVQVVTTGNVDAGFYVDSVEASPNIIEISGAASIIEKIAEVRVAVDVGGARESFTKLDLVPKVYDSKGREIDSTRLSFSHSVINVTVNVIPTKIVPIEVRTVGDSLYGYAITGLEYDPSDIEIAGLPKVLSGVESIVIQVDVNGVGGDMEKTIDLASYIPEGTKLVSDTVAVAIRVKVEKLATREFAIPIDDLDIRNLSEDYDFRVNTDNTAVHITVMGLEEKLALLTAEDLGAYIDLSGMGPGIYLVSIETEPLEGIYLFDSYKISITLSERNLPAEDESPNEDEEEEGTPEDDSAVEDDSTMEEDTMEAEMLLFSAFRHCEVRSNPVKL